jgi:hypothetical protein
MKINKEALIEKAYDLCNEEDKSTEYMIQYIQDFAVVSHDEVMDFLIDKCE